MKRIQVVTMGCSKNRVDSEHLMKVLEQRGYELAPENEDLSDNGIDEVIINTCGFICDAKEESIAAILEAVEAKKRGLIDKVSVFGCLSERYKDELPAEIPEVDSWQGVMTFDSIGRVLTTPSHYAYLKISEGCDRRCSYCAIPMIRGPHVSVPIERIVNETQLLASSGVKELILIAQDTSFYGMDLYGRRRLGELLERLSDIDGIEWIRIHYSYPEALPDDVLKVMRDNPKVCKYLDIPLQHSEDAVLRAMRRGTDSRCIRDLISKFRDAVPGVVLRTTLMVGHPGEGEREFENLLKFVGESRFERLGAFIYSEEEGTYGASFLKDEVPQEVKQERYDRLMELQSSVSEAFNISRIGTGSRVLIDSVSSDNDGDGSLILVSRSQGESPEVDGEILLSISGDGADSDSLVGTFADVKIISANEYDLLAEIE